jgi:CHAD domain-containing protein
MMELVLAEVRKPVRQLRKSLKRFPPDPTVKDVHDLRTRARRVEAITGMLIPGEKKTRRQLLKVLKPLCKAAGEVRDMDVLAAKARILAGPHRDGSPAELLQHLQATRIESSRKLAATVAERQQDAREKLKHFSLKIEKYFQAMSRDASAKTGSGKLHTDAATRLMDELSHWPAFNIENLHAFRIKVKELRNTLQLAEGANQEFINALEGMKTKIGDWHDWQELGKLAGEVLDPGKHRAVLGEIEEIGSRKFKQALKAAHAVRAGYLGPHCGVVMTEP